MPIPKFQIPLPFDVKKKKKPVALSRVRFNSSFSSSPSPSFLPSKVLDHSLAFPFSPPHLHISYIKTNIQHVYLYV